jgi:hypothetical protein
MWLHLKRYPPTRLIPPVVEDPDKAGVADKLAPAGWWLGGWLGGWLDRA